MCCIRIYENVLQTLTLYLCDFFFSGFHDREEKNLLDVVGVGEEHGHPANDPWIDIPNQCKISSKNIASSSKER